MRPVCLCVALCRAGGVNTRSSVLERICPNFGQRKKGGAWSKYLPEVTLPDTKHRIKIRKNRRANTLADTLLERFAFFAPCLPLCAALRNRWSSCRARQFEANLPRFWAKGKRGYWELISAIGDFDRCEKCLQVKASHQMGWRFLKSPAVRGFFSSQN